MSNPMFEASAALHELYDSLRVGGFSVDEALTVVAKVIIGQQS